MATTTASGTSAGASASSRDGSADVVDARAIVKRFGAVTAVRGLTFRVPARCVCGLLGPNGAGKSTTIRMLAGVLVPDEGELRVGGHDVRREPDAARSTIGYLPETAPVHPELRVREMLAYRAALVGLRGSQAKAAIDRAIDACSLGQVRGRLVGALSRGYRQRVGLAAAILAHADGGPRLVILDEPSVGLDPHQLLEFRSLVRELGRERTVLLSSHILAEIEATCDRAILVANGSIVAEGAIDELRSRGGDRYVVETRCADARAALASVRDLVVVHDESLGDGFRRVVGEGGGVRDLREAIAAALAAAGATTRELRREQVSLESLFVTATRATSMEARA
ncbi:MAG: ABC transporter ATP-binding protein [Phycisphaerales bacterium]